MILGRSPARTIPRLNCARCVGSRSILTKRMLFALLLITIPSTLAAEEKPVTKTSPLAPVTQTIRKERKQIGISDNESPVNKTRGPEVVGPPNEIRMTKASGKKFDLRSLPFVPPVRRERPEREAPAVTPMPLASTPTTGLPIAAESAAPAPIGPNAAAPPPLASFDGLDFANWGAGHPPDTNGDVGPNYYIQTINTSIGVFRKSDGARVAAFTFDTFMSQGNLR